VVNERRDPEVWYFADELGASLEVRLSHLVVLLLHFENFFTRLLIQPVNLILHLVYPLDRILLVLVCQQTTIITKQ